MPEDPTPHVRAVHCDYRASDEEVYAALRRATLPLQAAWAKLRSAKRIAIKFNQAWPPDRHVLYKGQLLQLVSEKVARAILRLLREETDAELVCAEISVVGSAEQRRDNGTITLLPLLQEFGVAFVDGDQPPHRAYPVSGGGQIFRQYLLPQTAVEADAFVSVQKLKNHAFMGVTLCLKNLFGLVPTEPHGRSRQYYHHLVRMPYVLADLGRILNPTLSILDALIGQAGREWGEPNPRVTDALIAGDQVVATDACAAVLMGHDPAADWLTPPFHRDRNALLVAAQGGFGTVDPLAVDFQSELQAPLGEFYAQVTDARERVVSWRRTTAEQALYYRDHLRDFAQYAGEYVLLQDFEVRWHGKSSQIRVSRRELARGDPDQALWLKYVDPDEAEGEHYEVYERTLREVEVLSA
ncbi:MAG TPA: DUF362 domain-containing protein [Anaerolineae bacterium]|nr:DUF362 domain-containing protein [Anaerolineae bacterium]